MGLDPALVEYLLSAKKKYIADERVELLAVIYPVNV